MAEWQQRSLPGWGRGSLRYCDRRSRTEFQRHMMTAEHLASTREARLSKDRRPQHATTFLLLLCALSGHSGPLLADTQTDPDSASVKLAWSADSVGPARFVSVHGRRAAV